ASVLTDRPYRLCGFEDLERALQTGKHGDSPPLVHRQFRETQIEKRMPEGVELVSLNVRHSPARGDVHVPAHERHDDVGAGLKRRRIACVCRRAGALESREAEIAQMRREKLKRFRAKTAEI